MYAHALILLMILIAAYGVSYHSAGSQFDYNTTLQGQDLDTEAHAAHRHAFASSVARWAAAGTTACIVLAYALAGAI